MASEGSVLTSIAWMPGRDILISGIALPGGESRMAIPAPFLEGHEDLNTRLEELTTGSDMIWALDVDPAAGLLFNRRSGTWLLELDSPLSIPESEPRVLFPNIEMIGSTAGRLLMGAQFSDYRGRPMGQSGPVPGMEGGRAGLVAVDPESGSVRQVAAPPLVRFYPVIDPSGRYLVSSVDETLLLDLDRGSERRLARSNWILSEWLPDGDGVLGTLIEPDGGSIGVLRRDGVDDYELIIRRS